MFNKQINGVNIIHYRPTPLEQIQSRIQALKYREDMKKRYEKPANPKGIKHAYREFLEVCEKYDMIRELEEKGEL